MLKRFPQRKHICHIGKLCGRGLKSWDALSKDTDHLPRPLSQPRGMPSPCQKFVFIFVPKNMNSLIDTKRAHEPNHVTYPITQIGS